MKVKELIKRLEKLEQDALVVMSKDSEGNGYSPLSSLYVGKYAADSTWSGDFYPEGSEYEEIEGKAAVCLDPVN